MGLLSLVVISRKRTRVSANHRRVMLPQYDSAELPATYAPTMLDDALRFLSYVKRDLAGHKLNQFMEILNEFQGGSIGREGVISRVKVLFDGHTNLILGFNKFVPPGYKISIQDGEEEAT